MTKAARPFIEAGYLTELDVGPHQPRRGPAREPAGDPADREYFLGIKITGDDLIGVVTDLRAEVRASYHHALADHEVGHVVTAVAELAERLLDHR